MSELLSQAGYAKHRRCSRAAVTKALKAGRIELTPDGRIDPEAADADWLRNSRARIAARPANRSTPKGPQAVDGPADYQESRAKREQSEAAIAALQLGAMNGELVSRESVERGAFLAARQLRDALGAGAGQIGAAVAPLTSAHECEQVVRQAHRKLLEDFTHALGKMLGEPPVAAESAPPA